MTQTVETYSMKDGLVQSKPFSILGLVNAFLRHSRLFGICILLGALVGAASIVVVPRRQIAESTFVVEGDALSRSSALAAQFGVSLGSGSAGATPSVTFYQELLTSRPILLAAVQMPYTTPDGPKTLIEYYGVDGPTPAAKLNAAVTMLRQDLKVTPDITTNVVTLRVTANSGAVATQINQNLLALVAKFNVEKRRTQAALERDFLLARGDEARRELRAAETKLEDFLQSNRTYQTSPQLAFQAQRLQEDIQLKRDISASVGQSFERARIEAVRNTPSFTIIDSPVDAAYPDGHGPVVRAVIGIFVALLLAAAIALLMELAEQSRRTYPEEYKEFARLRRSLFGTRPAK
jgi:uncharacterized protein involved in exopolysaccharide biosynthesis